MTFDIMIVILHICDLLFMDDNAFKYEPIYDVFLFFSCFVWYLTSIELGQTNSS